MMIVNAWLIIGYTEVQYAFCERDKERKPTKRWTTHEVSQALCLCLCLCCVRFSLIEFYWMRWSKKRTHTHTHIIRETEYRVRSLYQPMWRLKGKKFAHHAENEDEAGRNGCIVSSALLLSSHFLFFSSLPCFDSFVYNSFADPFALIRNCAHFSVYNSIKHNPIWISKRWDGIKMWCTWITWNISICIWLLSYSI